MFKAPLSFNGRITRSEYAISLCIWALLYGLGVTLMIGSGGAWVLLVLAAYWFWFAQGAKRCHDFGQKGWIQILPLINPFVLLLFPGNPGRNQYGVDPRNPSVLEMPAAGPPSLPVPPPLPRAPSTSPWGSLPKLRVTSFRCSSCGAQNKDIQYADSPKCEYCGSAYVKN